MNLPAPALDRAPPPAAEPPGAVAVRGPLTIANAESWRRRLAERLAADDALHVDLAELTQIDVFGVQLLYAACSTADFTSRPFSLVNAPELYSAACEAAGFGRPVLSRANARAS